MSDSASETALKALASVIEAGLPAGAEFARNLALPARIPATGLAILRDGDPGEPEVLMSPETYVYTHRAELELVVEDGDQSARDATFDALKTAVASALAADRTLGGAVEWAQGRAPAPVPITAEGAEALKGASVLIELTYATSDPLT